MSMETKYDDHEWNVGVKAANKGYHQLDDVDTKVFKDEPKRAKIHLEKALNDFSSALTHFAKAEVGLDGQKAIKDVDAAVGQLGQGLGIDVFDLDGEGIRGFAKGHHCVVVGEGANEKVGAKRARRGLLVRVHNPGAEIPAVSGLQQHFAELASAENAELEVWGEGWVHRHRR